MLLTRRAYRPASKRRNLGSECRRPTHRDCHRCQNRKTAVLCDRSIRKPHGPAAFALRRRIEFAGIDADHGVVRNRLLRQRSQLEIKDPESARVLRFGSAPPDFSNLRALAGAVGLRGVPDKETTASMCS